MSMFSDEEDDFLAPAAHWAVSSKTKTNIEDCDTKDIFSHRNNFESIARDSFEYDKQKAAKAKAKQERDEQQQREDGVSEEKKASVKRESHGADSGSGLKKRRINGNDSKRLLESVGVSMNSAIDLETSENETEAERVTPIRGSPHTKRTDNATSPSHPKSGVNSLAQSVDHDIVYGDEVVITTSISKAQPEPEPEPVEEEEEEEDEDSDPEIAALARKARENARRKHELAKKVSPQNERNTGAAGRLPTLQQPDATIKIFITSPLPDTVELICHRKLSQELSVVRQAWCSRQKFDKDFADRIFFTYRGRRLYDSTIVRRLGMTVDEYGKVYREDDVIKEDVDKVHIEAVTEEIYQKRKAEKARQFDVANHGRENSEDAEANGRKPEPEPPKKYQKLIVRAKGKPDFRLKVTPTTQFHKIIKAAKKTFGFADDSNVYIVFDDERLSPDEVVGNTEMEDMDVVDMHLIN